MFAKIETGELNSKSFFDDFNIVSSIFILFDKLQTSQILCFYSTSVLLRCLIFLFFSAGINAPNILDVIMSTQRKSSLSWKSIAQNLATGSIIIIKTLWGVLKYSAENRIKIMMKLWNIKKITKISLNNPSEDLTQDIVEITTDRILTHCLVIPQGSL